MPNTWEFKFHLDSGDASAWIATLLQIASDHGFAPPLEEGKALVFFADSIDIASARIAMAQLVARIAERPGSLTLFDREGDDISIGRVSTGCRIAVSHDLHVDRPRDVRVERKLDQLFRAVLTSLNPMYAIARDEWRIEHAWCGDFERLSSEYLADVAAGRTPQMLFWRNYFRGDYFERVAMDSFVHLPRDVVSIEPLTHGMLVSLGDRPWTSAVATLRDEPPRYELVQ